ncbi:DEAD/DEAH box helicase [Glycomyces harbinensis]|uniref:Superfamily II DNA and RNA helicase n=1 Tax=Glycomyces harbinensis TaxID=58114 RepID=A0A1G6WI01_9ACTN|nr:DEAD/DEAH box helicase [Glycomyces harbinensis]SDD64686.1 Superfamily II DNA and RNA helicase [Glycomyces harbinensis]
MTVDQTVPNAAVSEPGTALETPETPETSPAPEANDTVVAEVVAVTETAVEAVPETVEAEAPAAVQEEFTVETDEVTLAEDGPSFEELGLPGKITAALAEQGIHRPFPIQAATIPDALAGRDILGRGQTGSGKTLAFGLPTLARLAAGGRTKAKRPRAIILTPTRELAIQVAESLQTFGDAVGIDMKVVCGGTAFNRQIDALRGGVDMLVATPGRLRDLIRRGECSLDSVELAILDEADQMADMGFLPEVQELFDQLPTGGQRMLFSATLEHEIDVLVKKYLSDPVTHSVDPSAGSVTTMTHHLMLIGPRDKATMTAAVAARPGLTMVFVRTQLAVDRIADELRESGVNAEGLHGGMSQIDRSKVLDRFKHGRLDALVCTDVAARGIHVDGVDMVLHVDPPKTHKDYLHRAGRTARAGESGHVATLVLPHQNRSMFSLIERAGVEAKRHYVNDNFDPELTELMGARNFTDLRAVSSEHQATRHDDEVKRLERQIERLKEDAEGLRAEATRLREQAEREMIEGPSKRRDDRGPRRDRDDRGGERRGGGYRGNREGGSSGGYRGNREGGSGGGYRGNREGGSGGGYQGNREGGYRGNREGGSGGGYQGNREGGYRGNREGGSSGGYRGQGGSGGGYQGNRDGGSSSGGYRGNREGGSSYGDRSRGGYGDRDNRGARSSDDRGGRGGFRGDDQGSRSGFRGDDRGGRERRDRW